MEIEAALRANGKPVEFHLIEAPYGHDCFLIEEARQTPIIRSFLGGADPNAGAGGATSAAVRGAADAEAGAAAGE